MKLKKVLLLMALTTSFTSRGVPAAKSIVATADLLNKSLGSDSDDTPLAAEDSGFPSIIIDGDLTPAITPSDTIFSNDPLAKIALLRGQLVGMPEKYQRVSLVHGALLWEMGVIKSLFMLLITPEKMAIRLQDEEVGESLYPLGKVLQQFFYLAGGMLAPVKYDSFIAQRMLVQHVGLLYRRVSEELSVSKKSVKKKSLEETYKILLRSFANSPNAKKPKVINPMVEALTECIACSEVDLMNPVNLLPSVIMAFFWAKFIIGAESVDRARKNLAELNRAITLESTSLTSVSPADALREKTPSVAAAGGSGADDVVRIEAAGVLEEYAIRRIESLYQQSIPNPLPCGQAEISGKKFATCGECGIHALFMAAFYNSAAGELRIPFFKEGFYDKDLVNYFTFYPTVAQQSLPVARADFANMVSHRFRIKYHQEFCDLNCSFSNIVCLVAQLIPGLYHEFKLSCVERSCGFEGAARRLEVDIDRHFAAAPACARAFFELFLKQHSLRLADFQEAGSMIKCQIAAGNSRDIRPALLCNMSDQHMDYELLAASSGREEIQDPIISCCNALGGMPRNQDIIPPLLFAAARMIQQQDFFSGYIALLPAGADVLRTIRKNISERGLLSAKEQVRLSAATVNLRTKLIAAAKLGLIRTCLFLIQDCGASINSIDGRDSDNTILMLAAQAGHFALVRILCDMGADVTQQNEHRNTARKLAIAAGHRDIADFLACIEVARAGAAS